MENFVIGIAIFLLLSLGFYGISTMVRKAALKTVSGGRLNKGKGPPPHGPDPGRFSWRLGKRPTGKTQSGTDSLKSVELTGSQEAVRKTTPPPSPSE